jgi:hypothetical protein
MRDLREGLATVTASPVLWVSIAFFALTNVTLVGPYSIAIPVLVKDNLQADVSTLGLLYAIFPIGYVLAGVWLGRKSRIHERGPLIYSGAALAGIMLAAIGLPYPLIFLCAAAFINGAALEAASLAWTNAMQELVPRDRLGARIESGCAGLVRAHAYRLRDHRLGDRDVRCADGAYRRWWNNGAGGPDGAWPAGDKGVGLTEPRPLGSVQVITPISRPTPT